MNSPGNIASYKRITKVLRIFTDIGFWVLLIAFVLTLVIGIFTLLGMMTIAQHMNNISLSLDGVMRLNLGEFSLDQRQNLLAAILFTIAAFSGIYGALSYYLVGILRNVEKNTPFVTENASRISRMGYVFLIGSVIVGLANSFMAYTLVESINTTAISVSFQLNTTMVVGGFLLLILAGIFRYGTYLQEEYDSTL